MTLLAVEPTRITIDPRRYEWCPSVDLPPACSAPGCTQTWLLQRHHIIRRSETGGPLDYITIDGLVVVNVCVLCQDCHNKITGLLGGHQAWIRYVAGEGWLWYVKEDSWQYPAYPSTESFVRSKTGQMWQAVGSLQTRS